MNRFILTFLAATAILLGLFAPAGSAQAQTAVARWSSLNLASGAAVPKSTTITGSDGNKVAVTWALATNGGIAPYLSDYVTYQQGPIATQTNTAVIAFNQGSYDTNDRVTAEFNFTTAVTALNFTVADIDYSGAAANNNWRDAVEVYYDTGNGSWVNVKTNSNLYSTGSTVGFYDYSFGNGFAGIATADDSTNNGRLSLNFGTLTVKRIRIVYYSYAFISGQSYSDPEPFQYIALSDISYTTANKADLSLNKTLLTAAPYAGSTVKWRLTLANASSSTGTPTVTVSDTLPSGVSFVSGSGTGSYNSSTGIWTVGTIAPGTSVSIEITATVTGSVGSTITNVAQVATSSLPDPDSTPGNNVTTEDDYSTVSFTVSSGSRFQCNSNVYLSQGNPLTQLMVTGLNTNPLTFTNVGGQTKYYNATAYNVADNFMYAIGSSSSDTNHLMRIAADGSVVDMGTVANLPALSSLFYNAGVFVGANKLLIRAGNFDTDFYLIDVTTLVATVLTQPAGFSGNVTDFAYNPVNGKVYGVGNQTLYEFTVGAASVSKRDVGAVGVSGLFGAMFADALGNLYGANNNGGFYSFNSSTGAASLISAAPGSDFNDGSNCYNATMTFASDPGVTKTDGTEFYTPGGVQTYTITVSNPGPFGASNVVVSDPVPSGIPAANVSYTAQVFNGGTTTVSGTKTGALTDTVTLPVNGRVVYTVKITVPADRTDPLVNTVTLATGANVSDSNTANNTSVDSDVLKAILVPTKTSTTVYDPVNGFTNPKAIPGSGIYYTITVQNVGAGKVDADTTFVVDQLPAQTTFYNGDANGGAAGTDPVLFDAGTSTLSYNYGTDVRYATGSTPPTSLAQCNYTPNGLLDAQVRYICVNPKGSFVGSTSSPAPQFTIQFIAVVN